MSAKIALIAHDCQKDDIVSLVTSNLGVFCRYQLIATSNTGQRIKDATNLPVEQVLPGQLGGDIQIAALVATGEIGAVIFLLDPLFPHPQEPGLQPLQRLCAIHNIPLAINLATAEVIVERLRHSYVAHLIFNPVSGQGNAEADLRLIKQLLRPAMKLAIHTTTPQITAQELTQKAIAAHADVIIASGGDGTVSAVADTLVGKDIPLGIIPRGTANAFAVALGISARFNPIRNACDVIIAGNTRVVDAARCNGASMILLAGIGYEAEIVERADREAKNRWGALAYIMAGIQQLNEQKLFETEIEVEGVVKKFHVAAVTVANAAPPTSLMAQGGGTVIVNDGLLDVTIAAPQSDLEALTGMVNLLGAALLKLPTNREDIISLQTKRIKVTANPPQKVVVDGEIIGTTPVEIECIPGGLTVLVPLQNNNQQLQMEGNNW